MSKKRDRPAPAWRRHQVARWGRGPRDQVAGVGRVRKKRDSFAGALLAQGNVGLLRDV